MIRTVAELAAAAKKAPKKLDFGSFSAGYRLALEWLAASAGFQFNAIPYKASAQMNTDLMGGQIVAAIDGMSALAQQARSGKLRVVAVTGERRHPEFPDIPTVRESGYPDFAIYGWSALYTRSETPDDITTRLADAMQKALASNAAQDYVKTLGAELIGGGPSGMRQFQADQLQSFRRVADLAGIKPE